MPKRVQKETTNHSQREESSTELSSKATDTAELEHQIDDVLDEIDSVLQENAEEFVNSYIQKGGE